MPVKQRSLGKSPWKEKVLHTCKALTPYVKLAALFVLFYGSVAGAFEIPSSSMENTLQIGDRILVNKLSYGFRVIGLNETLLEYDKPQRGDIVVFTLPDDPVTVGIDESDRYIIKRVIGLPGETIEVRGSNLYVNSKRSPESHSGIKWVRGGINDFGPVKVPPATVLLLGDNRDLSKDSRFWKPPFLKTSRIVGRAFVRYWPPVRFF